MGPSQWLQRGEKEVVAFSFCTLIIVNIGTEYLLLIVSPLQRNPDADSIDYDGFEPVSLAVMNLFGPVSTLADCGEYSYKRKKSTKLKKYQALKVAQIYLSHPVYVSEGETFLTQKE
jgi:hypothetical protein